MTSPHERVRQLIALASGPTTPTEEARTAAVAALRIIAREKLLDGQGGGGFFDVKPKEHCPGCKCFSNVPDGEPWWTKVRRESPPPPRPEPSECTCFVPIARGRRAPCPVHAAADAAADREAERFWDDAFRDPKAAEKKRYGEGWDRTFGGEGCLCSAADISINGVEMHGARVINSRCPIHGSKGR